MVSRHLNTWERLQLLAVGLLLVAVFAPLPDPLDRILTGVGLAILLAFVGVGRWERRRERQADQSSSAAISSSDQT